MANVGNAGNTGSNRNEEELAAMANAIAELDSARLNEEDETKEVEEEEAILKAAEELVSLEKPKGLRKKQYKRKAVIPATTVLQTNPAITNFYSGRMVDTEHYTYTAEGNLQISGVRGVPDTIIRMDKTFVKLKVEDYETLAQARKEALKNAEADYEAALGALRIAYERYKEEKDTSSAEAVVLANKIVEEKNKIVSRAAFPEVWTDVITRIQTNKVLLQYDPYETRTLGYPVFLFKHHDLPLQEAWGHYEERGAGEDEDNEETMEGGGLRIRFITDVEDKSTGHFHPFYVRNFVFHETEYCSPYQAYQAERFKELGEEELRKQILGTRSGRTMHTLALRNTTLPKTPQALWEDILFHFFHQHKDLAKELEATGSDKFHVMDKQIPADYAAALEKARLRLRELGDTEVMEGEVKEKAITEEEQKKAKVGAIVNNFRRKV